MTCFEILKKYDNGLYIIDVRIKDNGFWWFTDCGEWFFYIQIGKQVIRFSSAGFIRFKIKDSDK